MCGITGIIGNPKVHSIDKMLNLIAHRGPDGCYIQYGSYWVFGHARLSIIDLSSEADQPMTDPDSGNVIVFNGEIYNYVELKNEIGIRYRFRTASDTEVLLAAYEVFGINFLNKLRGMFSFALFDQKRGDVLIARDRFGIKPLYYRAIQGNFLFSSEIKSLVNIPGIDEHINERKAYEFLANSQLDTNEETLFDGIYQLKPAHYFRISRDGTVKESCEYWKFPEPGTKKFDRKSEHDLIALFDEVTSIHMRSDVPVGTFLSGGIDSSCVTAFALRNLNSGSLNTFSAVLPYHHPENALIPEILKMDERIHPNTFLLGNEHTKKSVT
jgi:asparagine synthase (glutamine-hydrolysing)